MVNKTLSPTDSLFLTPQISSSERSVIRIRENIERVEREVHQREERMKDRETERE
jgi:hypothetical protein